MKEINNLQKFDKLLLSINMQLISGFISIINIKY